MSDVSNRIGASLEALGPIFLPSIRPLAVPNSFGDELVPAGTATLVWHRGKRYLLTAAHVVELYPEHAYYIGTNAHWVEIANSWRVNKAPNGDRDADILDIAIQEIAPEFASQLDGCEFLPADRQSVTEHVTFKGPSRSKYAAVGYPLNAFKYKRHSKTTVPGTIAYAGTIASPVSWAKAKLSATSNIVLDYEWDSIAGEKGPELSPKLEGISGGAIIRVPAIERAGDLSPPTLVGIAIEERRAARLLVGTRLGLFFGAIDGDGPAPLAEAAT